MPFDDSAGYGEESAAKQAHFREILVGHMASAQAVIAKWQPQGWAHGRYLYWDLHAGPGVYESGLEGSPATAIRVAGQMNLPIDAGFFECDERTVARLREHVGSVQFECDRRQGRYHIVPGDHRETVPAVLAGCTRLSGQAFGLVYADPNGTPLPIPLLQTIAVARGLKRLDFLVYVAATTYKRIRGAGIAGARYLEDDLHALGKPHIWIREPMGRHQWTFAVLSAWEKLPVPKRLGFVKLESSAGRSVMETLNLSAKERAPSQPALLEDARPYRNYAEYLRHPRFLAIRAQVMERAAGQCERCRQRPPTEPHHLRYPPWGTFDVPENLLAVCHPCHCELHGKAN